MDIPLKLCGSCEAITVSLDELSRADHSSLVRFTRDDVEQEIEAHLDSAGCGWLRLGGQVVPFFTECRGGITHIWMGGRQYAFEHVRRTAKRGGGDATADALSDIQATMPGIILKINVSVGDVFKAHKALLVMESMKMEMSLSAPTAGRVVNIHCQVGDLVEPGALLISVEPVDSHE